MSAPKPAVIGREAAEPAPLGLEARTGELKKGLSDGLSWLLWHAPAPRTEEEAAEREELQEGEGPGEAQDGAKSGAPAAVAGFKPGEDPMETFVQALSDPRGWLPVVIFVSVQLGCVALTGDSFFGLVTGHVVESLTLSTGTIMRWHMFSASAMWLLGAAQFLLKRFRQGERAWVHRLSGRIFLFLWFAIAGPSAMYLSLMAGTGPSNAQVAMAAFSAVSMDTTVYASYYLWRGWNVARRRALGKETWDLHRRAMVWGMLATMSILFQRPFQLVFIVLRKALVLTAAMSPESWEWWRWGLDGLASSLLDHNVNLSVSTCTIGGFVIASLLDGPRSRIGVLVFGLHQASAKELFGNEAPSTAELLFWRLRLPAYVAARAWVTSGFKLDPNPEGFRL